MTTNAPPVRAVSRTVVAATVTALLAGACSAGPSPALPASEKGRSDLIATAQQALVGRCLHARGAAGPPPRQEVLFGAGPAELSITLATGHTVRAHTDGCLAEAHRYLYGDQERWFRAQVTVNNLRPEAQARLRADPGYRAALARRASCGDHDTACVRASGVEPLRDRLEPARLAQVRAAHREEITTYGRLRERAVRRAAGLLADRPSPHQKGNAPS
ncbi:hypothetical protein [Streptomyces sp. NPDC053755]|uniref:hypothetical protein n=1 Tax=Streptomyces sp. NPDC053755 TaxID=3155815 RepID=UPI003442D7FF